MQKHYKYILILSVLLWLPILSACVMENFDACPPDPNQEKAFLKLTINTANSGRVSRAGTDEGLGLEHGRTKENIIHNLTLFLYIDAGDNSNESDGAEEGDGVNTGDGLDGEYEVIWSRYVDENTLLTEEENPNHPYDGIYKVQVYLKDSEKVTFTSNAEKKLRILVVANAGNLSQLYKDMSINDICRKIHDGDAWTAPSSGPVNGSDRFLMASAFNGAKTNNYQYTNDGRITPNSDRTLYSGEVSLERVAARIDLEMTTAEIQDGKLVYTVDKNTDYGERAHNTLTLLNAIPVNSMRNKSYLVKQVAVPTATGTLLSAGDEAGKYVITPNFSQKPNADKLSEWYGNSRASWLRAEDHRDALSGMSPLSSEVVGSAFQYEDASDNERAITVAYANENTHPESLQLTAGSNDPSDYLTGLLFRAQYHPAVLYTDGACSQTTEYVDGQSFYLFRRVGDAVNEANNLYFATTAARNAYIQTLPAGGKYETADYPGGICYYNVWIKHRNINADPTLNFPMKYGIVRNYIYRISLNFSGIGQPTPEIREPNAITTRIFVKKWNFRPQPEIIM